MKFFLTVAIFLLSAASVLAEPAVQTDDEMVNETMTAFIAANNIPGAAVDIYLHGQAKTYYYGYADSDKKIPITKNTVFEVECLTKLMTSLVFAQQLDLARMKLDDSILDYLPNLPPALEDITLENLATHTSGLSLELPVPQFSPDEEWIYSNAGTELLADAIEKRTKKDIGVLYRTNIMQPLKMTMNAIGTPDNMQKFLAAAIGLDGTPETILYPMRMTQSGYIKLADRDQGLGWEIHSLAANNIHTLLNDPEVKVLGPVKIDEIYEKPRFNPDTLIDKTGQSHQFRAYIAVIPATQSGIVILTNKVVSNGAIVNTARNILFKLVNVQAEEKHDDK